MGSRCTLSLVFALVLITVFSSGFVSKCLPQSSEKSEAQPEATSFIFWVYLRNIDWSTRTFNVYVDVHFSATPYNLSYPIAPYVQNRYQSASLDMHDRAGISLFSIMQQGPPYYFEGNATTSFQLAGPTQLYPFDRYALNITFVLPLHVQEWNVSASSIINQTNTWFSLNYQVGELVSTVNKQQSSPT
jgi:hypothetical protein